MRAADYAHRPILVGYDGSPSAGAAMLWAAREATARYAPLLVVHAWRWPAEIRPVGGTAMEAMRHHAELLLAKGVADIKAAVPGVTVRSRLEPGSPAAALLTHEAEAQMIVVGARGRGGFDRLRIGSTAVQTAAYARRVVVVTAGRRHDDGPVVLGVDATPGGDAALALAFEEAALRGLPLHAVQSSAGDPDRRRELEARFQHDVAPWCAKYPYVELVTHTGDTPLAEALPAAGVNASLIVVGEEGRHGPADLPLGMVTQAVLHAAPCPVAVVHGA
ncbi:nucleotide-binding universal stress UspA family protein [Thermocatellispora tengchongensis]|uniref:Nucleotide-binding universal stress UspA family protein n=1 Tax=Thermocatellispora tengchongensis TaxID=1073253 RepID=A0A840PAP8_9ACTN|nr:universal stress protein [Thermocatellispora tengchongensis]MBB5135756.1 nucleotide-binding universal stress UspA family protein [Thermocatellispora tengchongensis]